MGFLFSVKLLHVRDKAVLLNFTAQNSYSGEKKHVNSVALILGLRTHFGSFDYLRCVFANDKWPTNFTRDKPPLSKWCSENEDETRRILSSTNAFMCTPVGLYGELLSRSRITFHWRVKLVIYRRSCHCRPLLAVKGVGRFDSISVVALGVVQLDLVHPCSIRRNKVTSHTDCQGMPSFDVLNNRLSSG